MAEEKAEQRVILMVVTMVDEMVSSWVVLMVDLWVVVMVAMSALLLAVMTVALWDSRSAARKEDQMALPKVAKMGHYSVPTLVATMDLTSAVWWDDLLVGSKALSAAESLGHR